MLDGTAQTTPDVWKQSPAEDSTVLSSGAIVYKDGAKGSAGRAVNSTPEISPHSSVPVFKDGGTVGGSAINL